jgi:hypothetical protein
MHYKLVDERPKTFILAFQTNDELARGLKGFRIRTEACFGKLQSHRCRQRDASIEYVSEPSGSRAGDAHRGAKPLYEKLHPQTVKRRRHHARDRAADDGAGPDRARSGCIALRADRPNLGGDRRWLDRRQRARNTTLFASAARQHNTDGDPTRLDRARRPHAPSFITACISCSHLSPPVFGFLSGAICFWSAAVGGFIFPFVCASFKASSNAFFPTLSDFSTPLPGDVLGFVPGG